MKKRRLGRSDIETSPMGMGCWAIGGPFWFGEHPVGWGKVDDQESIRAIRHGLDLGVRFFETADVYGTGHSETILGEALAGRRDEVVVATKFGMIFDAGTRHLEAFPANLSPHYIRRASEDSMRRLQTDYIDCYMLHPADYPFELVPALVETLEELVTEGKIRTYGWCTNLSPDRLHKMAEGKHFSLAQLPVNVLHDQPETIALCEQHDWGLIANSPLGMGLLSGKYDRHSKFPGDDVRTGWDLDNGEQAEQLKKLAAVREVLTTSGRTLVQGALAWLWARSETIVPIPGFRTVEQAEENAKAMELGPLTEQQMQEIDNILTGDNG